MEIERRIKEESKNKEMLVVWKFLWFNNVNPILQDLFDFLKEIGLHSSNAGTRNASIKFLGVLHRFVGPGHFALTFKF